MKEINAGRKLSQVWVDMGCLPLYGVIGSATAICALFMARYFSSHADIQIAKQVRMSPDIGQDENRLVSHNERMGMFRLNKRELHIFPFTFVPMAKIIERSTGQAPPQ